MLKLSRFTSFREQFSPHPFRTLLFVEWLLLGTIAIIIPVEIMSMDSLSQALQVPDPSGGSGSSAVKIALLLLTFLLFGLLGLQLPKTRKSKTIYITIEFSLFIFACFLQTWNSARLMPILVIIIIRSCLLFSAKGRWWMLGLTGLFYLLVQLPGGLFVLFSMISSEQILQAVQSAQGNWGWIQIFPDGRVMIQFQPEQVKQFLSAGRTGMLQYVLTDSTMFVSMTVFVVLLVNALLAERQGRKKLAIAHEQLYQYSCQIEDQAALQERNRIARDLHDSLGHLLTAQNIQLQNATLHLTHQNGGLPFQTAQNFLISGMNIGTQALTELRQTLNQLRDHPFTARSFQDGMTDLIQGFERMMPTIAWVYPLQIPEALLESIPNRIQVAIYRITEEALMNIYKHSQAQNIQIQLSVMNGEDGDRKMGRQTLMLTIADDGQGFEMSQNPTGYGLRGIGERAEALGGELTIVSQLQQGCQIKIIIPFVREERS
jgi:signal transduction histidine kinase